MKLSIPRSAARKHPLHTPRHTSLFTAELPHVRQAREQLRSILGNTVAGMQEAARAPLEREADQVADTVLRLPDSQASTPVDAAPVATAGPHGGGRPLEAPERDFMERRFGRRFSDVRIHTGAEAAHRADGMGAQAFTEGQHIYLGSGAPQPGSDRGRRLLAHELTHVVQQTHAGPTAPSVQGQSLSRAPAGQAQAKLLATGDKEGFKNLANAVMAGHFEVSVNSDSSIALKALGAKGAPGSTAQALRDVLNTVITDGKTTLVRFIHGASPKEQTDINVFIGGFNLKKIDLDDLQQLGVGQQGYDAGAALAHELIEQFRKQAHSENFQAAHTVATATEEQAIGAKRVGDSSVIVGNTMVITLTYQYPDGKQLDQIMTVDSAGNIAKLERKWRP